MSNTRVPNNHINPHSTYSGRTESEKFMDAYIRNLFSNCELLPFGTELLMGMYPNLKEFLIESNNSSNTSYLLEYLPDYILIDTLNQKLYFIEIKYSNNPLKYGNRLIEIRKQTKYEKASSMTVGVIAREAFYSYRKYFPETILIYATPYNENVLLAQRISDLPAIYVENDQGLDVNSNNYKEYEIGSDKYFTFMRNMSSIGSGKPSVNISLNDMIDIETFFRKLDISLDEKELDLFRTEIIKRGIYFGTEQNSNANKCRAFFEKFEWYQERYQRISDSKP